MQMITRPITRRSLLIQGAGAGLAAAIPNSLFAQAASAPPFVNANHTLGQVPLLAFGVNCIATNDDVDGTFGDRARAMGATLIRWPGGVVARELFTDTGAISQEWVTRLARCLRFCLQNSMALSIVVPAVRYFRRPQQLREEIRLVARTVTQVLGAASATRIVWEFGNEYYLHDDSSALEYARSASLAIDVLRYWRPNDLISLIPGAPGPDMLAFSERLRSIVHPSRFDLLGFHSYTRTYFIYTLQHLDTAARIFDGKAAYVSEWNVQSCWSPAYGFRDGNCSSQQDFNERTYGMSQAGSILTHFSQMMTRNIYAAAFWPVQSNNMTSAYPTEDEGSLRRPYVAGRMFSWLRETAGMRLVGMRQTASEQQVAYFAFANDQKLILFIDARNAPRGNYSVRIDNFPIGRYSGQRMSGPNDARRVIPAIGRARAVKIGNSIRVPLRSRTSHELIMVTMERS